MKITDQKAIVNLGPGVERLDWILIWVSQIFFAIFFLGLASLSQRLGSI